MGVAPGIRPYVALVGVGNLHRVRADSSVAEQFRGYRSRELGGPWMREEIVPLLGRDTERSVAK
jgi:hypothetical protein